MVDGKFYLALIVDYFAIIRRRAWRPGHWLLQFLQGLIVMQNRDCPETGDVRWTCLKDINMEAPFRNPFTTRKVQSRLLANLVKTGGVWSDVLKRIHNTP